MEGENYVSSCDSIFLLYLSFTVKICLSKLQYDKMLTASQKVDEAEKIKEAHQRRHHEDVWINVICCIPNILF